MADGRNDFDEFLDAVSRQWIDREIYAFQQELLNIESFITKNKWNQDILPYLLIKRNIENEIKKLNNYKIQRVTFNYVQELKKIENTLTETYGINNIDSDEEYVEKHGSPITKFLYQKRKYLKTLIAIVDSLQESKPEKIEKEKKGFLRTIFDIGKKIVGNLDDLWVALRSFVPPKLAAMLTPILIGGIGFLIHLGEGYQGANLAYTAYMNEKIGQRRTRILTSALSFALAGAGVGMSMALLASAAGATVAYASLLPVLIPAALTAIYGLSLWRQAYIFHRAKDEESRAYDAYQDKVKKIKLPLESLKERILIKNNEDAKAQTALDKECAEIQGSILPFKQAYDEWREKRLQAERDVAFTTIEVIASSAVLVGIILGSVAVVGASVGTFGAAPLALIFSGVLTGMGTKVFESQDEKHHHAYTRSIRQYFLDRWKGRSPSKKNLDAHPSPTPTSSLAQEVKSDVPITSVSSAAVSNSADSKRPKPIATDVSVTSFSGIGLKHSNDSNSNESKDDSPSIKSGKGS